VSILTDPISERKSARRDLDKKNIAIRPVIFAFRGQIIAEGPPEQVARAKKSLTAKFLEKELGGGALKI
jgi:hypothetical protein